MAELTAEERVLNVLSASTSTRVIHYYHKILAAEAVILIQDAETAKQARIDALNLNLADAQEAIRQQAERYKVQCQAEDALDEKCAQLEEEKHQAEAAQRERDAGLMCRLCMHGHKTFSVNGLNHVLENGVSPCQAYAIRQG